MCKNILCDPTKNHTKSFSWFLEVIASSEIRVPCSLVQIFCVYPKNFCLLAVWFHVETVVQPYLQIHNLNFPSGCQWEWAVGKDEHAAFFNFLVFLKKKTCLANKTILKSVLGLELCWISFTVIFLVIPSLSYFRFIRKCWTNSLP